MKKHSLTSFLRDDEELVLPISKNKLISTSNNVFVLDKRNEFKFNELIEFNINELSKESNLKHLANILSTYKSNDDFESAYELIITLLVCGEGRKVFVNNGTKNAYSLTPKLSYYQ